MLPWGDYTIQYAAIKANNGMQTECTFQISVYRKLCMKNHNFNFKYRVEYDSLEDKTNIELLWGAAEEQYNNIFILRAWAL